MDPLWKEGWQVLDPHHYVYAVSGQIRAQVYQPREPIGAPWVIQRDRTRS